MKWMRFDPRRGPARKGRFAIQPARGLRFVALLPQIEAAKLTIHASYW